jgi:hypothetical protein
MIDGGVRADTVTGGANITDILPLAYQTFLNERSVLLLRDQFPREKFSDS